MRRIALITTAVVALFAIGAPAYAGQGPSIVPENENFLPNTGVKISMLAFGGLTLLILGAGVFLASRKRREGGR